MKSIVESCDSLRRLAALTGGTGARLGMCRASFPRSPPPLMPRGGGRCGLTMCGVAGRVEFLPVIWHGCLRDESAGMRALQVPRGPTGSDVSLM